MATSFATPVSEPSLGSSFDDILDSAVDTAPDTSDAPAPEADAPETPVEQAPASDDEPLIGDDDDLEEPEEVEQDGRQAYKMSKGRMDRFQAAHKFQQAVSEIGLDSVESAQQLYQAASDAQAMEMDFRNPLAQVQMPDGSQTTAINAFLDHWHGTSPDGMAALATNILPFMAQKAPQVVRQIEGQVSTVLVSRAYNQAQAVESQQPGSDAAKAALYKAQSLDYALNGKHKTLDQLPKQNPQNQQMSDLQRREQDLNRREKMTLDNQWNQFDAAQVSGAKTKALDEAVDGALKIVQGKFSPKVLGSMRNSILNEAQQALKSQFEWNRNHGLEEQDIQREFRQALKTGQRTNVEPRVQALVQDYKARLSRIVPSIARGYIQDATTQAVASNRQTHDRARASQQTAPSGNGRAPNRGAQGKFTSVEQGLDAIFG